MYDHILVPTDGSDEATEAVEYAVALAADYGATVHALHVVEPPRTTLPSEAMRHEEVREEYRAWGEELTADVVARAEDQELEGVAEVAEGIPHEEIDAYATDHGVDLIIMGKSGRTGLRDRLLGSVTEKTARISDVPVLLTQPGGED
jgi:nucleotide-binding universal stress UspA family protein